MKKIIVGFIIALGVFQACKKEETKTDDSKQNTPVNAPSDTITNFMVKFYSLKDSSTQVANYNDPDGAGPKPGSSGGVVLTANTDYEITYRIEDGSNPSNPVVLNNKIQTNSKDYILCASSNMGITVNAADNDGKYPLGLIHKFTTGSSSSGKFYFSLKYQKGIKNGSCDIGVEQVNCSIPIQVN